MNRLQFLKRFGLLAAVTAIVPACASHRGAADSDEHNEVGEKHDERHETPEQEQTEHAGGKAKDDDDDDDDNKKPQNTPAPPQ